MTRKQAQGGADAAADFQRCWDAGSYGEALGVADRVLADSPDLLEAMHWRGLALRRLGQPEAAADCLRQVVERGGRHPELFRHWAYALKDAGRHAEAAEAYRGLLALTPDDGRAHYERARHLAMAGQREAARGEYAEALRCDPSLQSARYNAALLDLLEGRWANGWRDFEFRWEHSIAKGLKPDLNRPWWQGEPLGARALLVVDEQGLGDVIQFSRFVALLRQREPAAELHFLVRAPLLRLFAPFAARHRVALHSWDESWQAVIDCQVMLLSLPHLLGVGGAVAAPAEAAPLPADPAWAARWWTRLAALPGRRLGLVWAGNGEYAANAERNIPLELLRPLLDLPGISWVSLQMDGAAALAGAGLAGRVADWMGEVGDMADTAGLIAGLDGVVTVDTSVAHLAAALGCPTWLLNRFHTDWRWQLDRADSPWYPSLTILRQATPGDWPGVAAQALAALSAFCARPATGATGATPPAGGPRLPLPQPLPRWWSDSPLEAPVRRVLAGEAGALEDFSQRLAQASPVVERLADLYWLEQAWDRLMASGQVNQGMFQALWLRHFYLGRVPLERFYPDGAIPADDRLALLVAARREMDRLDWPQAIRLLDRCIVLKGNDPFAATWLASSLAESGDYAEADRIFAGIAGFFAWPAAVVRLDADWIAGRQAAWAAGEAVAAPAPDARLRCRADWSAAEADAIRRVIFLSVDGRYFVRYLPALADSLQAHLPAGSWWLHVHLINADAECDRVIEDFARRGLPVAVAHERVSLPPAERNDPRRICQPKTYYACARLLQLPHVLASYGKRIWLVDADMELQGDLARAEAAAGAADLAQIVFDGGGQPLWQKFYLSATSLAPTPEALRWAQATAAYVRHFLDAGRWIWSLDQAAIYAVDIWRRRHAPQIVRHRFPDALVASYGMPATADSVWHSSVASQTFKP